MAARKTQTSTPVHETLIAGHDVKSRADGSVHTIKANGKVVAEVCVGSKKVRLNFRSELPPKERKALDGKSKSWPGGGCIVTESNLSACRAMIDLAIQRAQPTTETAKARVRKVATPKVAT